MRDSTHLKKEGVARFLLDARRDSLRVGDEEVIANNLDVLSNLRRSEGMRRDVEEEREMGKEG